MTVTIHPTAIVEKGAELDSGVEVGPFCIVGPHVKIGKNTSLQSHVVIKGDTEMGSGNQIYPFASIGQAPQDLKYKGERTTLKIGDRNTIREYVTLQLGTVQDKGTTIVGNGNLFMAYTHVAHDCVVENSVILANGAQLAGHVYIEDGAILGALSGVHQFCRVGTLSMTGAGAMVSQDIPPFCVSQGDHAKLRGLNLIGMRRKGLTKERIQQVKETYRIMFLSGAATIDEGVQRCNALGLLEYPEIQRFVQFIQASKRGVARPENDELDSAS